MDILTFILFIPGLGLLIRGAEVLVRGASSLAVAAGISPLVVGLTVVAYGTSAPELAVTIQSALADRADIALGNVVGSNIANVLLIIGLSASLVPLLVARQLIRFDVPLMIGLSVLVFLLGADGRISRLEGVIFALGALAYTVFVVYQSRKETQLLETEFTGTLEKEQPKVSGAKQVLVQLGLIVAGLGMLVLGSRWLINGAVAVATTLGISELVIGLTIVAVGTSLPEIATSVIATMKGQRDIAVGNVVGSNIFNILFVLGLGSAVASEGIPVSEIAFQFDIPIMVGVAVMTLPLFITHSTIQRWEGVMLLGYYLAYTAYLFLSATGSSILPAFSTIMVMGAIPLTVIFIVVSLLRYLLARGKVQPAGSQIEGKL